MDKIDTLIAINYQKLVFWTLWNLSFVSRQRIVGWSHLSERSSREKYGFLSLVLKSGFFE